MINRDHFLDEVNQALDHGLQHYAREHGLPEITWFLEGPTLVGIASIVAFEDHERVRALELWAEHLGLGEADRAADALNHSLEWNATFSRTPVTLLAITDEEAWRAERAREESWRAERAREEA